MLCIFSIPCKAEAPNLSENAILEQYKLYDALLDSVCVSGAPWSSCWNDVHPCDDVDCMESTRIVCYDYQICGFVPWLWSHCANDNAAMIKQKIYYADNGYDSCGIVIARCQRTEDTCSGGINPGYEECSGP